MFLSVVFAIKYLGLFQLVCREINKIPMVKMNTFIYIPYHVTFLITFVILLVNHKIIAWIWSFMKLNKSLNIKCPMCPMRSESKTLQKKKILFTLMSVIWCPFSSLTPAVMSENTSKCWLLANQNTIAIQRTVSVEREKQISIFCPFAFW